MKFILRIIVIGLLGYLGGLFLPWWSIVCVCFIISFLMYGNDFNVFLSGFIGIGVLWLLQSWQLQIKNKALISNQIITLLDYNDPIVLVIFSGLIGAILGGMGALTGNSLRRIYVKEKKKRFYG